MESVRILRSTGSVFCKSRCCSKRLPVRIRQLSFSACGCSSASGSSSSSPLSTVQRSPCVNGGSGRIDLVVQRRGVASTSTEVQTGRIVEPLGADEVDHHNGIHVDLGGRQVTSLDDFNVQLEVSLGRWIMEKRCAAWLHVPIEKSALMAEAAKFGFRFHHAEGTTAVMYIWLKLGQCKIHPFASHQVGVAGCIMHADTSDVIVVQDKKQMYPSWKFPGGLSEIGEDIAETAKREVLEETGLHTDFEGVLAFRQQHRVSGAFGRSDLYFVCHLRPLSFDIRPCPDEIAVCRWISLDELINTPSTTALTKRVAALVRQGVRDGFSGVTIGSSEFRSIYRGQRFKMFSCTLNADADRSLSEQAYLHDAVDARTK